MKSIKQILKPLFTSVILSAGLLFSSGMFADEKEDLTVLRNTVVNLLQTLVQQGVMSEEQARALVQQAQDKAQEEVAAARAEKEVPDDVVRVQYVPDIVKEEIRNQVRSELKAEVVADVVSQAKRERWGVKDALPGWLNRIKISGDIRVRAQGDLYDSGNPAPGDANNPYLSVSEFNDSGPFTQADITGVTTNDGFDEFLVTDEDRTRERIRMRLNLDAEINNKFSTKVRVTTGNTSNPVSTNQTLGEGGNRYDITLDQAYIKYQGSSQGSLHWLTAYAGRMPNPWMSTDLLWDDDLGFEGLAATGTFTLGSNDLYGTEFGNKEVFLTFGAFPLEEYDTSSSRDKWLFGGQLGTHWNFANQSSFSIAAAYYNYVNVQADPTPRDVDEFDASRPESIQKGNSVFSLISPFDRGGDGLTGNDDRFFALAADYDLINLTARYESTYFAPYQLGLTADYVKNIGYSSSEVANRVGTDVETGDVGYHFRVDFGWPRIASFGHWNLFAAYKYLERDAVLDAFTDSDFHLGGTDAEGWEIGGNLGIANNTWLSLSYRSANEIDGIVIDDDSCQSDPNVNCKFGIDVIQLDLNARY